jgi:hypothetical protein
MYENREIRTAKYINLLAGIKITSLGFQDLLIIISEGEFGVLMNQKHFSGCFCFGRDE